MKTNGYAFLKASYNVKMGVKIVRTEEVWDTPASGSCYLAGNCSITYYHTIAWH